MRPDWFLARDWRRWSSAVPNPLAQFRRTAGATPHPRHWAPLPDRCGGENRWRRPAEKRCTGGLEQGRRAHRATPDLASFGSLRVLTKSKEEPEGAVPPADRTERKARFWSARQPGATAGRAGSLRAAIPGTRAVAFSWSHERWSSDFPVAVALRQLHRARCSAQPAPQALAMAGVAHETATCCFLRSWPFDVGGFLHPARCRWCRRTEQDPGDGPASAAQPGADPRCAVISSWPAHRRTGLGALDIPPMTGRPRALEDHPSAAEPRSSHYRLALGRAGTASPLA